MLTHHRLCLYLIYGFNVCVKTRLFTPKISLLLMCENGTGFAKEALVHFKHGRQCRFVLVGMTKNFHSNPSAEI